MNKQDRKKVEEYYFIERMMKNMYGEMMSRIYMDSNPSVLYPYTVEFELEEAGKPYFYGYTMEVGPDGQPVVNKFGNIGQSNKTQTISEHRDPTVDVLESKEGNSIKIIADLPGVTKDNIKVTENQGVVNIAAENGDRKYNKNIPTGKKLDADKSNANFTNGVLELDIPLRKSEDEKNIRID